MVFKIIKNVIAAILAVLGIYSNNSLEVKGVKINYKEAGLYAEGERYIFHGQNPNNYVLFDNSLWRIVSFEKDGTIKIIKNSSLGLKSFDNNGDVKWSSSSLNEYLKYYYNSIKDKDKIIKHTWNIGSVNYDSSLEHIRLDEANIKYYGYIGLISIGDYLAAHDSPVCMNMKSIMPKTEKCFSGNYLNYLSYDQTSNYAWSISNDFETKSMFTFGENYFGDSYTYLLANVFPAVYLKSNTKLKGQGTMDMPYELI